MSETSDAGRLVQAYLASKGLQPTGENVSRALQMNAQSPGSIGGLVNQAPDSAASASVQQPSMMQRVMQQSAPAQQTPPTPAPVGEHGQAAPMPQAAEPPPVVNPADAASGTRGDNAPQMTRGGSPGENYLSTVLQAGGGAAALAALAALLPKGTSPDATPPPKLAADLPPAVPMQAGDLLQEALNKAMGPPQQSLVDDDMSVPRADEIGLPRRAAPITPSQLLKEKQMREGTLDAPLATQAKPHLPEGTPPPAIADVMRHAQTNPEGVGSLLSQIAKRAQMLRGIRP